MDAGSRTIASQLGETPAKAPNHPITSVAVKIAIAIRGSISHRHARRSVSVQLSCAMRGVLETIRAGNPEGGSYTGKVSPQVITCLIPASNSLQALHD